jgi:formylglycine-generating enzyme required for sulfatase activity
VIVAPTGASTLGAATLGAPTAAVTPPSPLAPTAVPLATTPAPPSVTPAPAGTATPLPGATRRSSTDQMIQVFVPAGAFTMGNDQGAKDERPAHTVTLNAFWIDRTEITNDMYAVCVRAAACPPPQQTRSISHSSYFGNTAFANFPVLFVSWTQAQGYCAWAGRRLPTEAEWEKAARGTDGRLYPWGNQAPDPARLNFGPSGVGDTVAVGSFPSNASPYGALDMAGNAWEWVADFYSPTYYAVSPAANPPGPDKTGCQGGDCRVLRGGAWDSSAQDVTVASRLFYGVNDSRDGFTIRCAQS